MSRAFPFQNPLEFESQVNQWPGVVTVAVLPTRRRPCCWMRWAPPPAGANLDLLICADQQSAARQKGARRHPFFWTCLQLLSELDSRRGCSGWGHSDRVRPQGRAIDAKFRSQQSRISRCRSRRWQVVSAGCCRTAVVAGQLRSLWVTRCVRVGFHSESESPKVAARQWWRKASSNRCPALSGLAGLSDVLIVRSEKAHPGFQHAPCRIAGCAVLAGVQSDRKTRCHFAQFKGRPAPAAEELPGVPAVVCAGFAAVSGAGQKNVTFRQGQRCGRRFEHGLPPTATKHQGQRQNFGQHMVSPQKGCIPGNRGLLAHSWWRNSRRPVAAHGHGIL